MHNKKSLGVKLAFVTAVISGFAVFINKFGVELWSGATAYTTAKNVVAALFMTGLVILLKKWPEIKALKKKQWLQLSLIGLIGGSIPFVLFFKSLTILPAPQAAFIHKTLFIWVALMAVPFLKERLSLLQVSALGLLFYGLFMFGAPAEISFNAGILMALGATILWAAENIIAKKALSGISSAVVGWARMFLGSLFLLAYLGLTGTLGSVIPSSLSQLGITMLVGLALFAYVYTWYSSLQHAPATIVSSILVIAAPITTILNAIFVTKTISATIILSLAIMLVAVLIITKQFNALFSRFKNLRSKVHI